MNCIEKYHISKFEFGWLTFFAVSANHSARYTRPLNNYGLLVLRPPYRAYASVEREITVVFLLFWWSGWTMMNLDLAVLQPSSLSFSSVSRLFFFRWLYCIEKHLTCNVFKAESGGACWFSYIVKSTLHHSLGRWLFVQKKSLPYFPAIKKMNKRHPEPKKSLISRFYSNCHRWLWSFLRGKIFAW